MTGLVGVGLVVPVPVPVVLDFVLVLERQVISPEKQAAHLAQQGVGKLETVVVWVVLLLPQLLIYVH